jgi:exopolyphosphatase/guanosine-5'-triphosphate,3'-diphosphate pyrophosphatase
MRVAAIDVGTNSVRLFVADARDGSPRPIDRDLVLTRLGEGVDRDRRLGAEPMRRTVDAIAGYHDRAKQAGAERVRIAATSAVRDAANRSEFLALVQESTGVRPEILSGEQEARLSFLGATSELDPGAGPVLVLDIGGGSTEFVVGTDDVDAWVSLDVGSVRLTERHVRSDPPAAGELDAVRADARRSVGEARSAVGSSARRLIGLAGTTTTLAAIALDLQGYDRAAIHHASLGRERVDEIAGMLAAMTTAERRELPAMPPGREDVIVAGAGILIAVMEGFGFAEVIVSEADILDGLILDSIHPV